MTNKRLGKGLEALITTHSTEERYLDGAVPIDKIIPNHNQPRQSFALSRPEQHLNWVITW